MMSLSGRCDSVRDLIPEILAAIFIVAVILYAFFW